MTLRHLLVIAPWGIMMWDHNSPSGRSSNLLMGSDRNALDSMSDAPSVVPCPMCTDQTIQGLVFPYSFN